MVEHTTVRRHLRPSRQPAVPTSELRKCRDQTLQISIHPGDAEGDCLDLLHTTRPLTFGRSAFLLQVVTHRSKGFDNRLHALSKSHAGEIFVQQLQLLSFVDRGIAGLTELKQIGTHDSGQSGSAGKIAHEHAIDQAEAGHSLRQTCGDEHGYIRMQRALIRFQLDDPALAPVLGVLALPQDRGAADPTRIEDDVMKIGAADSLRDGLDRINRKAAAQESKIN